MRLPSIRFILVLAVPFEFAALPLAAQDLVSQGPELVVHQAPGAGQMDGSLSIAPDGSRIAYAWSSGQNIFARFFDGAGVALTPDQLCNSTLVSGDQNQPEVQFGSAGTALVAWSDRAGNDGQLIGIFARLFDSDGAPLGAEFQVNQEFLASQFRPALAATPSGGFVAAWTGQFDGDAFFRVLSGTGAFLTGDVFVNTFDYASQVLPEPAVLSDGTLLIVFEDSLGFGGVGSGLNLWGRRFQLDGTPLDAMEFQIASTFTANDQRTARSSVDPVRQRFFVVWEDFGGDGDGWGVFGRVFDSSGSAIGDEFQINEDATGDQRRPEVATDEDGFHTVCWESGVTGSTEILARRVSPDGQVLGSDTPVSVVPSAGYLRPEVAVRSGTSEAIFVYDGPGAGVDLFTRRFDTFCPQTTPYCIAAPNSVFSGGARIASSGTTSIAANDLVLEVTDAIPGGFGLFFYGKAQTQVPFFDGFRCVNGAGIGLFRLQTVQADAQGRVALPLDVTNPLVPAGTIEAGSTWNFQLFYRDTVAMGGTGLNYSDALQATFCP